MNVYKTEISELLKRVEKKYGKSLRTTKDFEDFSSHLKTGMDSDAISTSTLKRMWGYVNDLHSPRMFTLDTLSRYIGFDSFSKFIEYLQQNADYNSSFFPGQYQILACDLQVGQKIELGWSPNRYVLLRYQGDFFFEVQDVHNSKLCPGDIFRASSFVEGQPLFLPYVMRNGSRLSAFVAGRKGGLTILQLLDYER